MNILLMIASRSSENDTKNPRPGKAEDFSVARKSISHVLMLREVIVENALWWNSQAVKQIVH